MDAYVLAIDVGGTKLAGAPAGDDDRIVAHRTRATLRGTDAEGVFAALAGPLPGPGEAPAGAVGIGSAGPLDPAAGTVSPVGIPAWHGFPRGSGPPPACRATPPGTTGTRRRGTG